jgi:4a-hydroxytetrahydrobiopterin dehydratase
MAEEITPRGFHEFGELDDWRVLARGACAHFPTGSFDAGVALVNAIATVADALGHHPDVDLRYGHVTVRLLTHESWCLTDRDVALAGRISAVARELGVAADPAALQDISLTLGTRDRAAVRPFWVAVLGYRELGAEDAIDPLGRWPGIRFQPLDGRAGPGDRLHVDVFVPHDQAEARIAAALAAGGRLVSDRFAPAWWTLADPEGNQVDVATWQGRD